MPELPFPDLTTAAARETEPPPFEQIVERARRRRRHRIAAAALTTAAALVLAVGGAALTVGQRGASPSPAKPSPTSTAPSAVGTAADQVIARGGVADFGLDDRGDLLTVWSTCLGGTNAEQCEFAWKLVTKKGTWTGMLPPDSGARVTPANGAFILTSWDRGGIVVGTDGSSAPLRRLDRGTPAAGSVAVAAYRGVGIAEAKTDTWSPLVGPDGRGIAGAVTDGETVWAQELLPGGAAGARLAWSTDGRTWHEHDVSGTGTTPGPIIAAGDHVAASAGSVADDYNPLAVWSTSTDAGVTWTDTAAHQLPFHDTDEMAATPDGTLYVRSLRDGLFRSTDSTWQHFEKVPGRWLVSSLHQVRSGVAMLQYEHRAPSRVVVFDDAGRSSTAATFD